MRVSKVDANQKEIVEFLRNKGVSVGLTHNMRDGFPDLVCGYQGKNILLEVKDGNKAPSQQTLTAEQKIFHLTWRGQVAVVNSPDNAWAEVLKVARG